MGVNISIAMGTYNGGKYLQEQLESFSSQFYLPYELVVCDDGSTDNTIEILQHFASTVSFPVRIYKNEQNLGFSSNFIKCAGLCKGNWIAFSDQDDVWMPEKLLRIRQVIDEDRSEKVVLICHSADLVDENLKPTGRRIPDVLQSKTVNKNSHYGFLCIPGFTTTFKSQLLSEIDSNLRPRDYFSPNDKWQSHDKWIAMLANTLGDVSYISDSLALYRRHSMALSGAYDNLTPADRIQKAATVGAEYYRFQSHVAKDCAESYRRISEFVIEKEKIRNLLDGAFQYERLSEICELRAKLYERGSPSSKLLLIFSILVKGGYWGNYFYALGTLSFLKDVTFSIGLMVWFCRLR